MAHTILAAITAGALAGSTMMSAPLSAAIAPTASEPIPANFTSSRLEPLSDGYDCWGRCGWRDDRRWRRDRVGAGDVILGAAIIGGIAAIISSENRRNREREVVVVERDRYIRDRDDRRPPRDDRRGGVTSGLDSAAAMCADRIERDVRIDSVDNVARTASGWQVNGATADGGSFECRIGNDGRIEAVDYGESIAGAVAPSSDQWSDDSYMAARNALGGTVRPDLAVRETTVPVAQGSVPSSAQRVSDRMPTYPGGPIPGEEIPETAEGW
jgi:hypothetical protein